MEAAPPGRTALNLAAMLGPIVKDPFPEQCQQFSILLHKLYDSVESSAQLADKGYEFIFGSENELERALNDTGAFVRTSLSDVGVGSLAEAIFGEAPKRPPPHAKLVLKRAAPGAVTTEVSELESSPTGVPVPEPVPSDFGVRPDASPVPTYSDLRVDLLHLTFDGADGLPFSDLRASSVLNADAKLSIFCDELLRACVESLCWIASENGDCEEFKRAYLEAFPNATRFSRRFVDVEKARVTRAEVDSCTWRIGVEAPVDYYEASRHYPRLGELLGLVNPFLLQLQCKGTESVWLECRLEDGVLTGSVVLRDGRLIGAECGTLIDWDDSGCFTTDAVVEFSLVPLGLSLGAVPFPRTLLRCEMERSGKIAVTCLESQESDYESVASVAFDVESFRRFLQEGFRLTLAHVPADVAGGAKDVWVVRCFAQLIFPSGSVVFALKQWFKDFASTQLKEMDTLKAAADFYSALSSDAAMLSAVWRREQAAPADTTLTSL